MMILFNIKNMSESLFFVHHMRLVLEVGMVGVLQYGQSSRVVFQYGQLKAGFGIFVLIPLPFIHY